MCHLLTKIEGLELLESYLWYIFAADCNGRMWQRQRST